MTATVKAVNKRDTLAAARALHDRPLPTLLAWAPDDRVFPIRYAERLQAMIPGARLERIADSRAFIPFDQPGRLAELIGEFVARGADRRARFGRSLAIRLVAELHEPPADAPPRPALEADALVGADRLEADGLVQSDARGVGKRDPGAGDVQPLADQEG